MVPLSFLLSDGLKESLRLQLKDTRDKENKTVELGKLSRKEWLQWYKERTSLKID
jgi:hypothetical protein